MWLVASFFSIQELLGTCREFIKNIFFFLANNGAFSLFPLSKYIENFYSHDQARALGALGQLKKARTRLLKNRNKSGSVFMCLVASLFSMPRRSISTTYA